MGLNDTYGITTNILRTLCGWLCEFIYPLIAKLYSLFMEIGSLFYTETFSEIYNKISLIIGIFMVFRVTLWLIEMLVNPDMTTDKEKNPGKIVQKVLVAVILLAITPRIFQFAGELQYEIVSERVIEKIISPNNAVGDASSIGRGIAANLFIRFYTLNDKANNLNTDSNCKKFPNTNELSDGDIYTMLKTKGELNVTNHCLTARISGDKKDENRDYSEYIINFDGIFAVVVGAFVLIMLMMYCISLGTRYVQLIFLQIIAPIPIMCYLTPNKDNMFSKWVKQCTTTYLDLFIRVAIISFTLSLTDMLLSNGNNILGEIGANASGIIVVFLVLGLLTFAKKAPELVQELLPKSLTKASGDFGLSLKKRAESMVGGKYIYGAGKKTIGFMGALPGMAISTAVKSYNAHKYNQRENEKIDKYRNKEIEKYKEARKRVLANPNLTDKKRAAGVAAIDAKINKLENSSHGKLRKNLQQKNKKLINAYDNVKNTNPEAAANLMEKITENRASGMGHRNQVGTIASGVIGGTMRAANAAIHGQKIGDIIKKSNDSHVKQIMNEQGWYKEGGIAFPQVVQRTISQIQRNFGLETEGQAIQYIMDELDGDVKTQEEILNQAKEKERGYSSSKSSVKSVENEGSSEYTKNKPLKFYDYTTNTWKSEILSTRTGTMKTAWDRVKEYYNKLGADKVMENVDKNSTSYGVLSNLIETIAKNSSSDTSKQQTVRNELTEILNNSSNYAEAFDMILTDANQRIGKSESDYGKEQAAAAVLSCLFEKSGQIPVDSNGDKILYGNQTIVNEYESLMREIDTNSDRYSDDVKKLQIKIKEFVSDSDGNIKLDVKDFDESTLVSFSKIWGNLKEQFEIEQAIQARIVAAESDKLQQYKHQKNAFGNSVMTRDATNADKFGGGK